MEPVVIAFIRGMVMVGEVAWAVKGMAEPSRMRLCEVSCELDELMASIDLPLYKVESCVFRVYKVTMPSQCVDR